MGVNSKGVSDYICWVRFEGVSAVRRYLIIFLAIIFSIGLFFLTKYILSKLTKNNQIFYSTLVSVIGFCIFVLFAFLYLEIDSYDPSYSYQPPTLIDGKVKDGNFLK